MLNLYALIVLAALLLDQALTLAAGLLDLRALRRRPPAGLEELYDRERYEKAQAYKQTLTRFGLFRSGVQLLLLLGFWFAGGFPRVQELARQFGGEGPVVTGLLFFALLFLLRSLVGLPFQLYATFVIEERFGFNRTRPVTFITDRLKGLLLALLLGAPLGAGVIAFFAYAGPLAWLGVWGAVTLFNLFLQFIGPAWIMPLFNKFTSLEEGELKERLLAYARSVGFPVNKIFVIDGSRRSAKANAFFSGFGRHRRIALFDTLVADLSPPQLVAVLAHEIAHYLKKHILKSTLLGILHMGVVCFLLSLFLRVEGLHRAFGMEEVTIHGGLVFFGLLYAPLELLLSPLLNLLSRHHEFQADRHAAANLPDPRELAGALKRLAVKNLANLTPHPFSVFLYHSHPPLAARLEAIDRHVQKNQDT